MPKPNQRFVNKTIENYQRKNVCLSVSKKGRDVLLKERVLSEIKKSTFIPFKRSTNLFDVINERVFVKESFSKIDYMQLKDYLKQRKIVSCLPEVYGSLRLSNGKVYVFSKFVPGTLQVQDYLKTVSNPKTVLSLRRDIKTTGEKLISHALLPWDFKIRQFFYNPKNKKLYLCDNSVAMFSPKLLSKYFKKINHPIPSKLKSLTTLYTLHPFQLSLEVVNSLLSLVKKECVFSDEKRKSPMVDFKKKVRKVFERDVDKIILKTIDFYSSLPLEVKQKIQREILKETLEEFDSSFLKK